MGTDACVALPSFRTCPPSGVGGEDEDIIKLSRNLVLIPILVGFLDLKNSSFSEGEYD